MFFQFGPALTYSSSSGRGAAACRPTPSCSSTDGRGRRNRGLSRIRGAISHAQVASGAESGGADRRRLVGPEGAAGHRPVLLPSRGAMLTAYYTSNVEQYLFQNGRWEAFYANLGALPLDDASTLIRSARGINMPRPDSAAAEGRRPTVRFEHMRDVTSRGAIRVGSRPSRRAARCLGLLVRGPARRRRRLAAGRRDARGARRRPCRRGCPTPSSGDCRRSSPSPNGYFRSENLVSNEHTYQSRDPGARQGGQSPAASIWAWRPSRTSPT